MNIRSAIIAAFAIVCLGSFSFHPLNMCVGDISQKDAKLNLKFKFFVDNLQNTLTKKCGTYIDFETDGYNSKVEECLLKYLSTRFQVSVNNIPCKWSYKKGTLNKDVLLVEYEAPFKPAKIKSIKIRNTILFDDNLPEMKNIMNINLANKIRVLEFDHDEAYRTGIYTQEVTY